MLLNTNRLCGTWGKRKSVATIGERHYVVVQVKSAYDYSAEATTM